MEPYFGYHVLSKQKSIARYRLKKIRAAYSSIRTTDYHARSAYSIRTLTLLRGVTDRESSVDFIMLGTQ